MENYEQKYKKALENFKKIKSANSDNKELVNFIEYEYPELHESEDERIRKGLIKGLSAMKNIHNHQTFSDDAINIDDAIAWLEKQVTPQTRTGIEWVNTIDDACDKRYSEEYANGEYCHEQSFKWGFQEGVDWLEKQGEQNPTDKVEPKFKVGDWVVYNRDDYSKEIIQVYDIRDGRYYFTDNIHFSWSIKECDEKSHLWAIQDANDGDVLATKKGNPFIYDKDRYNNGLAYYYAGLDANKELTLKSPHHMLDHFGKLHSVSPATKEQRDLLFQKMKEAGYKWDAENKKLNKIEQESTWNEKIKGLNELETYILSLVPDRSLDAIKVDAKNIRYIINKEQKPAEWSEEDENGLGDALWAIQQARSVAKDENDMGNLWYAELWLQSLKDRIQPQPKQEWSEEDEHYKNGLIGLVEDSKAGLPINLKGKAADKCVDWLKSIKPNHWKPSDIQMSMLLAVLNDSNNISSESVQIALKSLYNDLKTFES